MSGCIQRLERRLSPLIPLGILSISTHKGIQYVHMHAGFRHGMRNALANGYVYKTLRIVPFRSLTRWTPCSGKSNAFGVSYVITEGDKSVDPPPTIEELVEHGNSTWEVRRSRKPFYWESHIDTCFAGNAEIYGIFKIGHLEGRWRRSSAGGSSGSSGPKWSHGRIVSADSLLALTNIGALNPFSLTVQAGDPDALLCRSRPRGSSSSSKID
jgi:hypothetical protein